MIRPILISLVVLMAGCAAQQPILKETPSGRAEGVFLDTTTDRVRDRLVGFCSNNGAMVEEATETQVVCSRTMQGGQAVMAQMIVGNSYSTTPEQKVRFVLSRQPDGVRVVIYQWVESQMAMGQVRRQELNSSNQRNDMQRVLWGMGAK